MTPIPPRRLALVHRLVKRRVHGATVQQLVHATALSAAQISRALHHLESEGRVVVELEPRRDRPRRVHVYRSAA